MPDFGIFRGFNEKLFGDKLYAGQLPINLGMVKTDFFQGLLDLYPNAAAAYSLRKLRSAYTGSAIKVRRASDNTEQDIGFVNNELDVSTLESFCNGTDGFVTTWYDQSSNAQNATQTTAANQPKIVSGGVVLTNGGKPCLQLDGTNDSLKTTLTIVRPYSIYSQFLQFNDTNKRMLNSDNANNSLISSSRAANTVFTNGIVVDLAYASANQNVIIGLIESTTATSKFFYNLNNIATLSPASNDWGVLCFGAGSAYQETANGQMKETIVWATDQSSNNTGIQNNMNAYYGIY
jgi:hypothetical protein